MKKRSRRYPFSLFLICTMFALACAGETDSGETPSGASEEELTLSGIQTSSPQGTDEASACSLPIDPGPCEGAMESYGYLAELGECIAFDYGGCDGNANRFKTLEECVFTCEGNPIERSPEGGEGTEATGEEEEDTGGNEAAEEEQEDEEQEDEEQEDEEQEDVEQEEEEQDEEEQDEEEQDEEEQDEEEQDEEERDEEEQDDEEQDDDDTSDPPAIPEGIDVECLSECLDDGNSTEECVQVCTEEEKEDEEEGPIKPNYTLGGLVCYMPDLGIGAASYHFVTPDLNYISYENAPAEWGLDTGIPYPDQVPFQSTTVNENGFFGVEFSGNVNWLEDYGATAGGAAAWIYEITFNGNLTSISGGSVTVIGPGGFLQGILFFGVDLVYVCTKDP